MPVDGRPTQPIGNTLASAADLKPFPARLQFTMPVEVDWSKNDTSLVSRFWASHPGEQAEAAEISDRILVFHRGIDTVSRAHAVHPFHGWTALAPCVPPVVHVQDGKLELVALHSIQSACSPAQQIDVRSRVRTGDGERAVHRREDRPAGGVPHRAAAGQPARQVLPQGASPAAILPRQMSALHCKSRRGPRQVSCWSQHTRLHISLNPTRFPAACLTFPTLTAQLGDTSVMQAVLKMGDGVQRTSDKPIPQELQHRHSKVGRASRITIGLLFVFVGSCPVNGSLGF